MTNKTKAVLKLIGWTAASVGNLVLAWYIGGKVGESLVEVSITE